MIHIGSQAPAFTLTDTERAPRSLSEFLGKKTVLAFYPGAFTGVCTKEMCAIRDSLAALNALDAQVLGISVDSPFANKGFADKNGLAFPLLSDYGRDTVKAYGVELHDFAGLKGYTVAQRSVFILDDAHVVRYAWIADAPGTEPDYDAVIGELKKF